MKMVEQAAIAADDVLYPYILKAVTEDLSYTYLDMAMNIPCGREKYYKIQRKFFWELDKLRNQLILFALGGYSHLQTISPLQPAY